MPNTEILRRLERMEAKQDVLASSLERLVRIEERQLHVGDGVKRIGKRVDDLDEEVRQLRDQVTRQGVVISWGERILWAVATGGVGWYGLRDNIARAAGLW